MKVVALLPFKNEAWILPAYLSSIAPVVDEIAGIDDGSADDSRALIEAVGGFVQAARPGGDRETHWRWISEDMLRVGRERGGTHFVCLDADEALTAPAGTHLRDALAALAPGEKVQMQWLALWKDPGAYRDDDSVWSDNHKDFAFADAPGLAFEGWWPHRHGRTAGPNDPALLKRLPPGQGAVLHYQFVPWSRFQVKQAWYRCIEFIRAPEKAYDINAMYAPTLGDPSARTTRIPAEWLTGIDVPAGLTELPPTWHREEMLGWFDEHGTAFFEPLQIWHIDELHERFLRDVGREPVPVTRLPIGEWLRRAARARLPIGRG